MIRKEGFTIFGWDLEWQQLLPPPYPLDRTRMQSALQWLAQDARVTRVFLEPHLRTSLGVAGASLLALVIGILVSFATQSTIVFRNATKLTFLRFLLAWVVIYFVNLGLITAFMRFGLGAYAAGAVATLPNTALSYLILSVVVFRKARPNVLVD